MTVAAFAYPEPDHNPIPRGGTEAEWRAWADGLSVLSHFGVRCVEFERGRVGFELPESGFPANPNGSIHGGVIAAILDDAVGCVFMSVADEDTLPATASLTIDYLRPAFAPLRVEARVSSAGRSLIHCDATVTGADGKPANRARAIMAVKRVPS
jgi:uncharacterized protein (TIGR00369 family)